MSYSNVQKDYYIFPVNSVYYVQFRDPITRRLLTKLSSGLRNKTAADKWAKKEYQQRYENAGKPDILFKEYASQFYIEGCPHEAERKANGQSFGIKTKTDNRHRLINNILTDPIGSKRLCEIKRTDSLNFRDRLIEKYGYTRKTQLILVTYRNIINAALNRGLIDNDPVVKITVKLKNKGKGQAANIPSVKNILLKKHWPNNTLWLAAMTAGIVGLRAGELCGLKWKDIDLKNEVIKITRSMNLQEGEKNTKSGKPRTAPYPKVLQNLLEPSRSTPDNFVFSTKAGKPLGYYALYNAMTNAVKMAMNTEGIPRITLHGLRHSINTALLEEGENPELLRAAFGWVDESTQEIYTHRELYKLQPIKNAVDKLFDGFTGD